MKYTNDNCGRLAWEMVDSWEDMTLVLNFCYKHLKKDYEEDEKLFHDDYESNFGEEATGRERGEPMVWKWDKHD